MILTLFKDLNSGEVTTDMDCYFVLETSAGILYVDAGKNEKQFKKGIDYAYFTVCNIERIKNV